MSDNNNRVEVRDDGFKIRKTVDFKTDMIQIQQEALMKTVNRYEQRDNPIEQFVESITVKSVDAFLNINEKLVSMVPDETRLKIQKAWQDLLLAF